MARKEIKAPKTAEELINGIDWELLKKQKRSLLSIISDGFLPDEEPKDDLIGIVNLLDSIQDYAVDVMGVDEKTVFDLHEE
jgi:hypothetical protein